MAKISFLPQMTVVEAYANGKKVEPADKKALLSPMVASLLIEGIAQNTTGSVYMPEVRDIIALLVICLFFFLHSKFELKRNLN